MTTSPDKCQAILADLQAPARGSYNAIAARHGVSAHTVHRLAHKAGIYPPKRPGRKPMPAAKRAAILADLKKGGTPHAYIARRHRVGSTTVHNIARDAGIRPPNYTARPGRAWPAWAIKRARELAR